MTNCLQIYTSVSAAQGTHCSPAFAPLFQFLRAEKFFFAKQSHLILRRHTDARNKGL
jgi:hypothetical protein